MRVTYWTDMLYYRIAAGTTRYSTQLVAELLRIDGIHLDLVSLYRPKVIAQKARERGCPVARSTRSVLPRCLQYLYWTTIGQFHGSRGIVDNADVVHVPWLSSMPHGPAPLVVTVHDMMPWLYPQYVTRRTRWSAQTAIRQVLDSAAAFITNSHNTANDLIKHTGISNSRVHVTPLAADERFRPVYDPSICERYNIDSPYILYVGTLEPRKNLVNLVRAFGAVHPLGHKLVISGRKGWMYQDLFATVQQLGLTSQVIFTGYVPDHDLPALMCSADVFAYPSLYEGFGLPVLEAMQCGTPVITTNVSSLPEVAGDACVLLSPNDIEGWTSAMKMLLSEAGLRDDLRERGLERARKFSWKVTAELTAEVYRSVARNEY